MSGEFGGEEPGKEGFEQATDLADMLKQGSIKGGMGRREAAEPPESKLKGSLLPNAEAMTPPPLPESTEAPAQPETDLGYLEPTPSEQATIDTLRLSGMAEGTRIVQRDTGKVYEIAGYVVSALGSTRKVRVQLAAVDGSGAKASFDADDMASKLQTMNGPWRVEGAGQSE